jgi:hypothetical protein
MQSIIYHSFIVEQGHTVLPAFQASAQSVYGKFSTIIMCQSQLSFHRFLNHLHSQSMHVNIRAKLVQRFVTFVVC